MQGHSAQENVMYGRSTFVGEWVATESACLWLNDDGTFRLGAVDAVTGNYYIEDNGLTLKLIHSLPLPTVPASFTLVSLTLAYDSEGDSLTAPEATRYFRASV